MYNLTARDIFWATEEKRVDSHQISDGIKGLSRAFMLASLIKLKCLEHAWTSGETSLDFDLHHLCQEWGDHVPEALKQLWVEGFDYSFKVELRKSLRKFLFVTIPCKRKVWLVTFTAASRNPRNEADYVPFSIPL